MAVEFVRSAFKGNWRFFKNDLNIITPGYYFFVSDDTPHVGDFHYFGSEDWRKGDEPTIVGVDPTPVLGNDKSLGWAWYPGTGPDIDVPIRTIGRPADFGAGELWPVSPRPTLQGGIDKRCWIEPGGALIRNLLFYALDNCALLLVYAGLLNKIKIHHQGDTRAALLLIFGADVQIDLDINDDLRPAFGLMQSPRNNLILLCGSPSNAVLIAQIQQSLGGAVQFGDISTLPMWWNFSSEVIDFCNAKGIDWRKPTFIVGHSFGAAAGCLIWHRIYSADRNRILRVVTFGGPKPGDARLLNSMNAIAIDLHVWNTGDVVPWIPPDNGVKAGLQLVFPWLPATWFGRYFPHRRYLFLDPGGVWRPGDYPDAPLLEVIGFVTALLVRGEPDPVTAHNLPGYIDRLKLHCPCPEAPFTSAVYILLFGTDECAVGGELLGGDGAEPDFPAVGLVLDGAGDLAGDDPVGLVLDGSGDLPEAGVGLVLDGSGDLPEAGVGLVLDGSGDLPEAGVGLVLDGSGILEPLGPGPDCASALVGTLGTTYSYTTTGATSQWYVWALTSGTLYHLRQTCVTWTNMGNATDSGTSCVSLTPIIPTPNEFNPCIEYTPSSDENIYFHIGGSLFGDTDYTIVVDTGAC